MPPSVSANWPKKVLRGAEHGPNCLLVPERQRPGKSEVERLLCNPAKAQRLLGWTPQIQLDDGLRRTGEYLRGDIVPPMDQKDTCYERSRRANASEGTLVRPQDCGLLSSPGARARALRPFTVNFPKPLVPLGDTPLAPSAHPPSF